MNNDFNMKEILIDAIENAMMEYANELHKELYEKYVNEFTKRMYEHRRKIVLDVCETIKIENLYDHRSMNVSVSIHL